MARFKLREGRSLEAKFYLSEAQTLISSTDYQPMKIQLLNAWGRFYQSETLYREAESSFEKALALARRLSHLHEEARALRNLGRLALAKEDYRDSLAKLQQAMASMQRLGAMYDVISIYHDLLTLFLAQEDFARAEEMANLLGHSARLLGYSDLNIKAMAALAYCEAHTNRIAQARGDYACALQLAREERDSVRSSTLHRLLSNAIDFLETTSAVPEKDLPLISLRAKLQSGDYKELLARLGPALECSRLG